MDGSTPAGLVPSLVIEAANLQKIFRRGQERVEALRDVSLNVEAGAFVAVVGPSGGGKSTLLHLLGGIDRPTAGSLVVNGFRLAGPGARAGEARLSCFRRENVGFVFQFYNLLPSLSALDNVALALLARGFSWHLARAAAAEALIQVDMGHRRQHRPAELSGGEQQRVAIARAVVGKPALVLADEPTGDLDSATAEAVLQLMLGLNRQLGITFVVATHNSRLAHCAGRCYELRDGRLKPTGGGLGAL
jgi:ABC-type lipoprotein export system ATPase subunit